MWKNIKQQLKLDKKDIMIYFLVEAGIFLTGVIVMLCAQRFSNEDSYFPLGTLMSGMGVVCMYLFGLGFSLYIGFNLAVSMGKTRRRYLTTMILLCLLRTLAGFFILEGFLHIEFSLYQFLYPTLEMEGGMLLDMSPLWAVGGGVVVTGAAFFTCGILKTFKKTGRFILVIMWLLLCWTLPSILGSKQDTILARFGKVIGRWFFGFSEIAQIGILAGAGIVLAGIACVMLRKMEVE